MVNRLLGPLAKRLVARAALSEEVHDALRPFADRCGVQRPTEIRGLHNSYNPYLNDALNSNLPTRGDDVVFITSRFRSGSTALWNAFRQLSEVTAYYEPFNERRFFEATTRGSNVDPTHLGVKDYWVEYDKTIGLDEIYDENWIRHGLFMSKDAWNPHMKLFIDRLVEQATGRPVLQFNRIDFRLPWLKRHYPNATILHLYRHPREQWCSFLTDTHEFPSDAHSKDFVDHFYLEQWARDLQHVMPLLRREQVEHPYELFYMIWKLSYLFGRRYATHSLTFEELITNPKRTLDDIVSVLGMDLGNAELMASAISPQRPQRWHQYADAAWYEHKERRCEELLDEFLGKSDDRMSFTAPIIRWSGVS